jgi:hypothetical protein
MTTDLTIDEIITQLLQLQVRETELLQQLRQSRVREEREREQAFYHQDRQDRPARRFNDLSLALSDPAAYRAAAQRWEEIEQITAVARARASTNSRASSISDVTPVNVAATITHTEDVRAESRRPTSSSFRIGSRVEITNRVSQWARGQSVTNRDRRGVVTKISASRIYFTTDSGIETFRAPKNLRLL